MAMARCRECNKKISTEADTCPNCGAGDPYDPPTPESATSKALQTLAGVGVVIALLAWCAHMGNDKGDVQAVKKPKEKVPLATKVKNMPGVCKLFIQSTILTQFNGKIIGWGKSGAWRKGRYNYSSHRVTFAVRGTEIAGINKFKILCCIDRKTEKFGIWSITDLNTNKTNAMRGEGSCRQ